MKKIFPGILFLALAALFLAVGIREGSGEILYGGIGLAILFLILAIRSLMKKRNAPAAQQPDPVPAPAARDERPAKKEYVYVQFKVAGVTFKNDDGSDRQTILRHIKFQDPPYVKDPSSVDVEIQRYEYNGEPAYRCMINGYQIGSVPKDQVQDVARAIDNGAVVTAYNVTGGGTVDGDKRRYGCEITLRYPAV